jgi:transcriptional regulator with XRE-family HTH domain
MEKISDRLTWLRKDQRLNQKDFAVRLGLSQSYISSLEAGEREVSANLMRQLVEQFGLSTDWLLKGVGQAYSGASLPAMLPQEAGNTDLEGFLSGAKERLQVVTVDSQNEPQIVLVPVKAHAGYALGRLEPTFMQDLPVLALPDQRFRHGTFRAFEVAGDSMEPTLYGKDLVVCRSVQDWRWIRAMELYVVVLGEDVLVKRLRPHEGSRPVLELISDNTYYPSVPVPMTEVMEIWHVTARVTTHLPSPSFRPVRGDA